MWVKILLLFFVFSFLFRTDHSFDQDLGRHLKLGEIIVKTGQVPKVNLFSYTNPDSPFVNTHWLFEVLAYFFNQTIGLQALLILKIIIILLAVWLTLKIIPKENSALLLPVGFIFLHVLRERAELRPEIFSFLFTALTYYFLESFLRRQESNKKTVKVESIFLLPLIQLIWINTHIYFFVGLLIQALFLIYMGYQYLRFRLGGGKLKMLTIIFTLSVAVSLINPNGLSGFLYPLNVTKNYGYTIVENQTMFLLESIQFRDSNFLFVKLSVGIILLSIIVTIFSLLSSLRKQGSNQQTDKMDSRLRGNDKKDGGKLKNILLSLTGLTLALLNVRSFPYLVFLSLPAVLQNFGEIKRNAFTKTLSIIFGLLLILESYFYLNGDYYKYTDNQHRVGLGYTESGKGALDFVLAHNLPVPIFNNFDIGSYIIYRGYPKYRVFVDGRPEAYPAQFFTGVYIPGQSDYNNFKEVEKIYGFKTIIFSHTDQTPWGQNFLKAIIKDDEWKLVYIDDFMVVLVKKEVLEQLGFNPIDLANLNLSSYNFTNHLSYLRLGLFLLNTQNANSGVQFIQKTLQLFPNDPVANMLIGQNSKNIFFW